MTNMRRLLKGDSLRMQTGGVQVPTGPGMDRAGFLARNPAIAQAQQPSAPTAAPTADAERAAREAPRQTMLRSGNSFGDAASAYSSTMPQSAQNQAAVTSLLARTPGMPGGSALGAAPAAPAAPAAAPARSGLRQAPETQTYTPMEMPSLQMSNGGNFLTRFIAGTPAGKALSGRDAAIEQAVNPPPPPAPPPAPAKPARTAADIRFRDGGTLRTGMGGHVPGKGEGDKIDAKYEPGEFVVSNDMLDAAPQLREQLSGLRGQVLAAKGMTPEEADAKSIVPGGLRAQTGIDPYVNHRAPNGPPISPPPAQIGYTPRATSTAVVTTPYRPNFTYGDVEFKQPPPSPDFGNEAQARARAAAKARAAASAAAASAPASAPVPAGKMQAAVNGAGTVLKGVGRVARVAAPLMEAKDIYDVAADANSTKIDVGTQVAEGASKLAMAGLGAKAGAAAGLPLGPVSAAAGGLIGGGLGYFGGEKLIGGLRQLTGSDPRSPDEQINAREASLRTAPAAKAPTAGAAPATAAQAFTPAQLGDSRNIDEHAGTMEVFTKGNGSVAGWTTVSTPAAKEARALRNQQYEQRQRQNFEDATTGPLGWKTREAERQAREDAAKPMYIRAREQFNTARGQDMSLRGTMAQIAASRTNNEATNATSLRTQAMENAGKAAAAQRTQVNDDRKYQLDVARLGVETANKNRDDKRAGEESFAKRVASMIGDDEDGTKAARVVNSANMFLGDAIRAAEAELRSNPGNAKAARDLERLQGGVGALDDKKISELMLSTQASEALEEYDGIMPWSGESQNSGAPIKSLSLRKGLVFDDYISDDASGNQVLPARALKDRPDLNRLVVK